MISRWSPAPSCSSTTGSLCGLRGTALFAAFSSYEYDDESEALCCVCRLKKDDVEVWKRRSSESPAGKKTHTDSNDDETVAPPSSTQIKNDTFYNILLQRVMYTYVLELRAIEQKGTDAPRPCLGPSEGGPSHVYAAVIVTSAQLFQTWGVCSQSQRKLIWYSPAASVAGSLS